MRSPDARSGLWPDSGCHEQVDGRGGRATDGGLCDRSVVPPPVPVLAERGAHGLPDGALTYLNMRSVLDNAAWFGLGFAVIALFFAGLWSPWLMPAIGIVFAVSLAADLLVVNRLVVHRTSYSVTPDFVYITRGAVVRRTAVMPLGQILSIETVEGPLLRRLGFAMVRFRCVTMVERLGPLSPQAVLALRAAAQLRTPT